MPVIDILPASKSIHQPLGPIPHNESTNAGNFAVLKNIFGHQFRLPNDAFTSRIFLIYGDQKTTQRIRTIKRRRRQAALAYDRLNWALPVPALFHIRMNYIYMISRIHFGGQDRDQSSLYHAMNCWGRKRISKAKSDFFALEELIVHSFQARITAILWQRLAELKLGRSYSNIDDILRSQSANSFLALVDDIREEYSTKEARTVDDQELQNHRLFLQHTQVYLVMKYAIKHADLGLLRRAIDRSCIYFHGSGQHKYAYEMLYFQRLISTPAATPALQQAILANGLINLRGRPDSWFEFDRLVEFHNGTLKELLTARRTSSLNLDYIFRYLSLNSSTFFTIQDCIDGIFGLLRNSNHTTKSAQFDIRIMAERLYGDSMALHNGRKVKFPALDLMADGAKRLSCDCLPKFNKKECHIPIGSVLEESILEEDDDGMGDDVDQFFNIGDSD